MYSANQIIKKINSIIGLALLTASFSSSAIVLNAGDVLPIPANPSADFFVGSSAVGTFEINNGSSQTNSNGRIGDQVTANGSATVTGTGSSWVNTAELFVGSFGRGDLSISEGASVSNTNGKIGDQIDSSGSVTVSGQGSSWSNNAELFVGSFGQGTLTIEDGATVTNSNGKVGDQASSSGNVRVSGAGTRWDNGSELFIGSFGQGELLIDSGATVSNTSGKIGDQVGSSGSVTVSGVGSRWSNSADLFVGQNGTGRLEILDQAEINVVNTARVGTDGTLNLGLGKLTAQNLELDGILSIALTEQGNGLLEIDNTAVLGGVLELNFLDSFLPEAGDSFTFLQANFISGVFDQIIFSNQLVDIFDFNFDSDYSGFSVSARSVSSVPAPSPLPLVIAALLVAVFTHKKSKFS